LAWRRRHGHALALALAMVQWIQQGDIFPVSRATSTSAPSRPRRRIDEHSPSYVYGEILDYIHTVAPGAEGSFSVDLRWSAPGEKTVTRVVSPVNDMVDATTREASVVGTLGTEHVGSGTQISDGQTIRYQHIVRD
jgi:hypothetical protein